MVHHSTATSRNHTLSTHIDMIRTTMKVYLMRKSPVDMYLMQLCNPQTYQSLIQFQHVHFYEPCTINRSLYFSICPCCEPCTHQSLIQFQHMCTCYEPCLSINCNNRPPCIICTIHFLQISYSKSSNDLLASRMVMLKDSFKLFKLSFQHEQLLKKSRDWAKLSLLVLYELGPRP